MFYINTYKVAQYNSKENHANGFNEPIKMHYINTNTPTVWHYINPIAVLIVQLRFAISAYGRINYKLIIGSAHSRERYVS